MQDAAQTRTEGMHFEHDQLTDIAVTVTNDQVTPTFGVTHGSKWPTADVEWATTLINVCCDTNQ